MRVILTINTIPDISSGIGGHYYSAMTAVDALNNAGHDALLVHFGAHISPLVAKWSGPKVHLPWPSGETLSAIREFWSLAKKFEPDLLVSYDRHTLLCTRLFALINRTPLALVIPEGFNPPPAGRYFPQATNAIVFAREQFARCTSHPSTKRANVIFAPNRVLEFGSDHDRIAALRAQLDPEAITILRICRLNAQYELSVRQTIEAARRLRNAGVRAQALVVGAPLDAAVVTRISGFASPEDRIVTDPTYFTNARALIDIADVVVGTGRSFMEAAAKGRVMMTPARDLDIPYLIDEAEFETAFAANFSPRVAIANVGDELATSWITSKLSSAAERDRLGRLARSWFDAYFDASSLPAIYESIRVNGRREGWESALNVPHHTARVLFNLARNKRRMKHRQGVAAPQVGLQPD